LSAVLPIETATTEVEAARAAPPGARMPRHASWGDALFENLTRLFALLVFIERRRLLPAAAYSIGVVAVTYVLFVYVLKTPLQTGPLGF